MQKAYASLHTAAPEHQADAEVSYEGYERVAVDWHANFGRQPATVIFPVVPKTVAASACYVAIGAEPCGNGEIYQLVGILPHIPLNAEFAPRIIFANIPEPLPECLSEIAKTAWHLVNDGLLDPAILPPKMYEAINQELSAAGVPVLKVTRSGAADMVVKMSEIRSLNLSSETSGNA